LITGASRGLGRALAERLAAGGTHVVLAARDEVRLDGVARGIGQRGGRADVLVLDLADADGAVARIRGEDDRIGGFDLVIANAGAGPPSSDPQWTWESLREPCRVNFDGAIATLTAITDRMIARGGGHLVGMSSLAALGPLPGAAAYCTPKAGLDMLLACLRLDLRGTGVGVTTVRPGFVRTDMVKKTSFWMPQLLEPAGAADFIVERLAGAPDAIDFPRALALAARWGAKLPRGVRDRIFTRHRTSGGSR
jgi:short-subunit dehydrogenase